MRSRARLSADVSLWSADLGRLAEEVKTAEAHADSFHFDVADGHFVPSLLFFPDLVAQLRPLTQTTFHVHLMVERPDLLCADFLEAGADVITVHAECGSHARQAIRQVRAAGKLAGVALRLESPIELLEEWLDGIDVALLLGTPSGVKGCGLDAAAPGRIRAVKERSPAVMLVADGGIRQETVPLLRKAGADFIVPGSLYFGAADRDAAAEWWRNL